MTTRTSDPHDSHIVSPLLYLAIFASLMVLTFVTVAASRYDFGPWNTVVAMAIAVLKATLVILFFMHVKFTSRLTQIAAASGFAWLVIMIGLTLSDVLTRGRTP